MLRGSQGPAIDWRPVLNKEVLLLMFYYSIVFYCKATAAQVAVADRNNVFIIN